VAVVMRKPATAVRIGLALSGGGAKGIAHVGVLKVLEEARIPVHVLAGSSMGGVVAAVYAAGRSAAELERLVGSLRLLDIVQRDRTGLGLLGQDKIASRLLEALGGDPTFDQLKRELALVAVDLETGEEVVIREGSVVEGVLATAALPGVFPPLFWRDRLLIDGAVLNPVPFDVVRHLGADRVVAVYTVQDRSEVLDMLSPPPSPSGGPRMDAVIRLLLYRSRWTPLMCVSERSLNIMARKLVEQRLQEAPPDVFIEVPIKGVGLFDLDQADVCLRAGEAAARQHLSELVELRDAPLPGWWTRWRRSAMRKLAVGGSQ
jgi:NTE family protein